MTGQSSEHGQLTFSQIHKQELDEIQRRREKHSYDFTEINQTEPDLVGLALSGGGIRSATFCLGFLQELHRLRLLRIFDYLSTVSGGGYLGGWWSAWLSRRQRDTSQFPTFGPEHIHDPVGLLSQTLESADRVAQDFRQHLQSSERGQMLIAVLDRVDLRQVTPRLYEPLAQELNLYIEKGETNQLQWERRVALVDTFPCELRGIFPLPEGIEPQRADVTLSESEYLSRACEDPIHHLRLFANYLTPRKGILSSETWRAISVIVRNLILTWLILASLLVGVMLLGQAYLFLNPVSQEAFRCVGLGCQEQNLKTVLPLLIAPIGVLLASTVVMGIAWLFCNRESSSAADSTLQWVSLLALAVLLTWAAFSIPALRIGVGNFFGFPDTLSYLLPGSWNGSAPPELMPYVRRLQFLIAWLLILLICVQVMWRWGLRDGKFAGGEATPEALSFWKREVRRGRFGRAQSKLLVTTVTIAVVLLFSSLTFLLPEQRQSIVGKIPFALVPLVWNIGSFIFTSIRAKETSWITRAVSTTMASLALGVLVVIASSVARWLLLVLSDQNSGYTPLNVPVLLSIAFCITWAIYELEDIQWAKVLQMSVLSAFFIFLVMLNVTWGAQSVFRYRNTNPGTLWRELLLTSALFAVLLTAIVFWKSILAEKMKRRRDPKGESATAVWLLERFGAAATLFIALTTVGFLIGLLIHFSKEENFYLSAAPILAGKIFRALVLTIVALAGGVILFRVLVNRVRSAEGKNQLTLRVLGGNGFADRPEALWLTGSVCLVLPIAMIGAAHYLSSRSMLERGDGVLIVFPLCVSWLLLSLMILRSLVIQKELSEQKRMGLWSGGIFEWLVDRIPLVSRNRQYAYQAAAIASISIVALLDTIMRGLFPAGLVATFDTAPVNWKLMAPVIFVSLPVFGVSIFKIPVDDSLFQKFKREPPRWMYSQSLLWILATVCIGWALLAGLLLPKWLTHVSHIPVTGLTPILLPIAAGCFLIVLFEFYWGERNSRRSLLLVAFAYLGVMWLFFMQLAGAGLNWNLVLVLLAAICVWVGALGWVVNPNAVSMHQFYKERLVRVYLGASNMQRSKLENNEITDTVAGDDMPLRALANCERGGPYHVINTTLNLVAGSDLTTAQRSVSSFVLSEKYCGSRRTNYCSTNEYMEGHLTLGTAVAVSGVAVSPKLDAKDPTAALALFRTLLNTRIGYWAPTPNRKGWSSSQPRLWPFYLVREFFAQTNDLADYCYLTDGGHFDNTGLYSLIERGCRFVVLVDCGTDSTPPRFQDLGEAIRRCRIDFGTEISLDLDPFLKDPNPTPSCFTVGKIKFAEEHLRSLALAARGHEYRARRGELKNEGIIVYVRPSLIANVSADVRQYAFENESFPQQPTNQWFGEAQFESYRRLGQTCAHSAFGHIRSEGLENRGRLSTKKIQTLFFGLHSRAHKA